MNMRRRLSICFSMVLGLVLVSLVAFDASQTRRYLNEQLGRNAQDAATSLALSMQSAWGEQADIALLRSLSDALFDRGLYRSLRLQSAGGEILIERVDNRPVASVPLWFQQRLPLAPSAGQAEVSDGWRTLGVLEIQPHAGLAYQNMWQRFVQALAAGLIGALLGAMLVRWFMGRLFEPVERIRAQVQGWTTGRFEPVQVPNIDEIRPLIESMNRSNEHWPICLND